MNNIDWNQEFPGVPDIVHSSVLNALVTLENQEVMEIKKYHKGNILILVAVMIMLMGTTVIAAVNFVNERMESMNHEKLEEYFIQVQNAIAIDNTNRDYTESEKLRLKELKAEYEQEGRFPEGELIMLDSISDYKGVGIGFLSRTTTFLLPVSEMSDEEILQIIDFRYKRDYSLREMNDLIDKGEISYPEDAMIQEEIITTDKSILQSVAVQNSDQELTISYDGEVELCSMAAGADCIYLAGWDGIEKMEIGSSVSTPFFIFGREDIMVMDMTVAQNGNLYLSVRLMNPDGKTSIPEVWIINRDGELQMQIDVSPYLDNPELNFVERMAVDEQGYLYMKGRIKELDDILVILNQEGELVSQIISEKYKSHAAHGVCVGKDGQVYILLYSEDRTHTNIATVNPDSGTLIEVYDGVLPGDVAAFDLIASGVETDFIIWGFSGIYTYSIGDSEAVQTMRPYEAPCQWEGCKATVLADGRVVFAASTNRRKVINNDREQYRWDPDTTSFFYVPTYSGE